MTESSPHIKTEAGGGKVTPVVLTDAQKESIKIRAAFMNGLAIGAAVAGAFAALNTVLFSPDGIASYDLLKIVLGCLGGWVAVYFCGEFHWDARKIIAKLDGPKAQPSEAEAAAFHKFNGLVRILAGAVGIGICVFSAFGLA